MFPVSLVRKGLIFIVKPGEAIRFSDLAQLTINHNGTVFLLSREVVHRGIQLTRRWRIYSGTSYEVDPPIFFVPSAPGGGIRIERTVGHTPSQTSPVRSKLYSTFIERSC